jgi:hypothetical protein
MLNYGYHLARAEGRAVRALYRALLPAIISRQISGVGSLQFDAFTYSGERNLPELVASIRSFLRYVGRPRRLTIVSDGTLSDRSASLLKDIDSAIAISRCSEWIPKDLPSRIYPYLTTHPTGKQLGLIMSLPVDGPAFYFDSDVLFFPGARELCELPQNKNAPARYLADCQLAADQRLFRSETEKANPVNTGVLFLFERPDWSLALRRLLDLNGLPEFFTNQTMTHLTMHANGGAPFDPVRYVLQLDDQFEYPDRYRARDLVLRHYVNPVRHKFWTAMARRAFW